mmetsp:Transcript_13060/g.24024  ORF Transcript_13060/g.24024 Transcript_13060/m.24024 type:complete len:298 (-) Transcript_13060:30-923(-)
MSFRLLPCLWILLACCDWNTACAAPCDCLNWKEVYARQRVLCGEGFELLDIANKDLQYVDLWWMKHYSLDPAYNHSCTRFFEQMNNNYCVNVVRDSRQWPKWSGVQWCYVSSECQNLNGGRYVTNKENYGDVAEDIFERLATHLPAEIFFLIARVVAAFTEPQPLHRDVAMKNCQSGEDSLLKELSPAALLELAEAFDMAPTHLLKMAYKSVPAWEGTWPDIAPALAAGNSSAMPLLLRDALANDERVVIEMPGSTTSQEASVQIIHKNQASEVAPKDGLESPAKWMIHSGRDVSEL